MATLVVEACRKRGGYSKAALITNLVQAYAIGEDQVGDNER